MRAETLKASAQRVMVRQTSFDAEVVDQIIRGILFRIQNMHIIKQQHDIRNRFAEHFPDLLGPLFSDIDDGHQKDASLFLPGDLFSLQADKKGIVRHIQNRLLARLHHLLIKLQQSVMKRIIPDIQDKFRIFSVNAADAAQLFLFLAIQIQIADLVILPVILHDCPRRIAVRDAGICTVIELLPFDCFPGKIHMPQVFRYILL